MRPVNLRILFFILDEIHNQTINALDICHNFFQPTEKERQESIQQLKHRIASMKITLDTIERDAIKSIEEHVI